jgi:dienelactone hydrolase
MLAHPRLLPVPCSVPCLLAFACTVALATVPARAQVTAQRADREPARTVAGELACLSPEEADAENLATRLTRRAIAALDRRDADFAALKTPGDVAAWAERRRAFFLAQLGGLPDRTPLDATSVRTIQADGYRIECGVFQSRPGHRVTANLYLPETSAPVPVVVVSSGHSRTAKAADYNQRFALTMVRLGMAAFCFDPIGQGERSQILDERHAPEHAGTTTEHQLVGIGSILVGRSTASYRLWDAMRAIDYVAARPEIDPQRIGFTGCSGGGTMTSYVMALDDRVACAAPACYLTTFRRLLETIGPQDAEQNICGQIAFGMDHADYLVMRAPKPTLISSTTQDFFSIDGSWDAFRQAKRAFGILGAPERVDLVEIAGDHGVQPQNLATIGHWMRRWLSGIDRPVPVRDLPVRRPEELLCTERGQVLLLPGEKSVFDLNAERAAELRDPRADRWGRLTPDERRSRIRAVLQLDADVASRPPEHEPRGMVEHDGTRIERVVLRTPSGLIPAVVRRPAEPSGAVAVCLTDTGKAAALRPDGPLSTLVPAGATALAVDLRGQGELATGRVDPLLTDWKTFSLAYLLGDALLGMRVEDALQVATFAGTLRQGGLPPPGVHLVAEGAAGIVALHAAALRPDLFASVTLRGCPESWESVVRDPRPAGLLDTTVHGVLETYDLPDLVPLAGTDRVGRR